MCALTFTGKYQSHRRISRISNLSKYIESLVCKTETGIFKIMLAFSLHHDESSEAVSLGVGPQVIRGFSFYSLNTDKYLKTHEQNYSKFVSNNIFCHLHLLTMRERSRSTLSKIVMIQNNKNNFIKNHILQYTCKMDTE